MVTPTFSQESFGSGYETAEHSSTIVLDAETVRLFGTTVNEGGVSRSGFGFSTNLPTRLVCDLSEFEM